MYFRKSSLNKVVITTVPFIDEGSPLSQPATLKAVLEQAGIPCAGIDLNIDIYNKIKNDPRRPKFLKFFYDEVIDEEIVDDIVEIIYFYVESILEHNPTIIGLSLFSYNSQVFTGWLCSALRHFAPDVKIVLGGQGMETLDVSKEKFPDRLKNKGLIDDYIVGDATHTIVDYVKGITNFAGLNQVEWEVDDNFTNVPAPNFDDYKFIKYETPYIPITDSRGCVQKCEFCDVIAFWKKFQYMEAQSVFDQMLLQIKRYNTRRFSFVSSVSNGNLKEFRKLVKMIAEYNRNSEYASDKIHWHGSFIIRRRGAHDDELWKDIADSNGSLYCGVESIASDVRIELGKNFTNEDLDHHLEMSKKYNVPVYLLMISSYPTETDEDYEYIKKWFVDHKQYAGDSVVQVQLTLPSVLPGTKLAQTIDMDWFLKDEPRRIAHGNELKKVIEDCGFVTRTFF